MEDLISFENEVIDCTKCPRLRSVTPFPYPHIIYAKILEDIKILVIGRNPGLEHSYSKINRLDFMRVYGERYKTSKFGKYIESELGSKVWSCLVITNLCKCSSPENSVLTPEEKANCLPYLSRQLKLFSPKFVILVGKDACEAVAGKTGSDLMSKEEFFEYNSNNGDLSFMVCGCYHPSYLARSGNLWAVGMNVDKFQFIRKELSI